MLFFIVLFAVFTFGFISMSYIAFGTRNEDFSTMAWAAIHCFQIIFGKFNYEELERADRVFAPVFLFLYLFSITFILSNIFIAILEQSYGIVKML
jgi:hypothetical protein